MGPKTKPARRLLHLEVPEARGLSKPRDAARSDTYVRVQLLDIASRPIKTELFNSGVVSKDSAAPKWGLACDLGASYDLNVDELPSVLVSVFLKAPALSFGSGDVCLGVVRIDLDGSQQSTEEVAAWLPLEQDSQAKSAPVGESSVVPTGEVRVTYRFSSPRLETEEEAAQKSRPSLDMLSAHAAESADTQSLRSNELHIAVLQARGLLALDTSLLSRERTSDPFVRIKIDGHDGGGGFEKRKTRHVNKDLSPVWNEAFSWANVSDSSLTINVAVKDKDTIGDKFMGCVDIALAPFADKRVVKKWYRLLSQVTQHAIAHPSFYQSGFNAQHPPPINKPPSSPPDTCRTAPTTACPAARWSCKSTGARPWPCSRRPTPRWRPGRAGGSSLACSGAARTGT